MPGFSGIGFGEMLVIGMLILIVFGPRRLPEISRSMGKAIREFKRGMNEIQRELDVADRESRWGARGSRAPGGSAVSKPATSSTGAPASESSSGPEPVIAPPAPGGDALRGTPDRTAVPAADRKDAPEEDEPGADVPATGTEPRHQEPRAARSPAPRSSDG